jgi:hypothetical protein
MTGRDQVEATAPRQFVVGGAVYLHPWEPPAAWRGGRVVGMEDGDVP